MTLLSSKGTWPRSVEKLLFILTVLLVFFIIDINETNVPLIVMISTLIVDHLPFRLKSRIKEMA